MGYVCLLSEEEFYYKNIDLGDGNFARLRALNRLEENKALSNFKINIDGQIDMSETNVFEQSYNLIKSALTQENKSFADGGAGWNLTKKDGTPLEITVSVLAQLPEDIWNKIVKGYKEHKKLIDENIKSAEKN